ncbi:MAG: hypothetical protein Q6353_001360 [Candidatus Sigynarchaeum springense]
MGDNLSRLYFSQDSEERRLAYQFLGEIALQKPRLALSIMKLLMKALVDKDIDNRVQGIHYLGEIGAISPVFSRDLIYPFILILLRSDIEPVLEFHALKALERISKDSGQVRDFLQRGIADVAYLQASKLSLHGAADRQAAVWRISKLGKIYFPAVIDLVPALVNRLVDDDDTVKAVAYKALLDLLHAVKDELFAVLLSNLEITDNALLKLQVLSLLADFSEAEPRFAKRLVPLVIKELENPDRIIHLKIQKILKVLEHASPHIFTKDYKDLLVGMLRSNSRYAYHWAVKTFTSSFLNQLHELSAPEHLATFIAEILSIVHLILKNQQGNIMQTRVVLMMLVHESKEAFSRLNGDAATLAAGLIESLTQIQRSSLASQTEVIAAYEKVETILNNSLVLLPRGK